MILYWKCESCHYLTTLLELKEFHERLTGHKMKEAQP